MIYSRIIYYEYTAFTCKTFYGLTLKHDEPHSDFEKHSLPEQPILSDAKS